MKEYVRIRSGRRTITQLQEKGFTVLGKTLTKDGVVYHMPRSVERSLKSNDSNRHHMGWNFELRPVSGIKGGKLYSPKKNLTNWVKTKPLVTPAKPKYILSDTAISFFDKGVSYQASSSNPMFADIVKKLKAGKLSEAKELVNIASAIDKASKGQIKNDGGILKHDGLELNETCTDWLLRNMHRGQSAIQPVVNFLGLLKKNPSPVGVDSLWRFIRKNGLIITPTGFFIGYRYLKDDFYDRHTGKHFNGLGQTLRMPREHVSADVTKTCAEGYHIGTPAFVNGESTVVECLVSPEFVVSCPLSEQDKLRVCEYTVYKILRHNGKDISEPSKQEDFFCMN